MSVCVTRAGVNDTNELIFERYLNNGCGICEKPGGEVFWFNHYSGSAHKICLQSIEDADYILRLTMGIFNRSTTHSERSAARIEAIKAVRFACGDDTILSYLEKNGIIALRDLFHKIGCKIARDMLLSAERSRRPAKL